MPARERHASPANGDRFVTTYGMVRQYAQRGDLVREGYASSVQRAEAEAETWRVWALELERLVLAAHPPGTGRCPGCEKMMPCLTRRTANRIRRESVREQELREREHAEREARYSANRLASMRRRLDS